ncbi:hypothetical protein [Methylobacterium sp. AMS5]|uniref:hypothetical protein n=1 Tax=Methylobacteriaceae TaxID=119045 RepID=UPI00074F9633|nr:hypothetical protein [Methylobacterium sp. AMS5]AMB44067.1 hypothetical protein Y590_04100 [Methylobacterium sp. AMS5]
MFPLLAALGLALGACSDEPSEPEMRQALVDYGERAYQKYSATALLMAGPRGVVLKPERVLTSFKKLACYPPDESGGHQCQFEAGLDGEPASKDRLRFVRAPNGTFVVAER